MDGKIPEDIREGLPEALQEMSGAELIARELFLHAITGKPGDKLRAIHEMLETEPKVVELITDTQEEPYIAPEDERRGELEKYLSDAPELLQ